MRHLHMIVHSKTDQSGVVDYIVVRQGRSLRLPGSALKFNKGVAMPMFRNQTMYNHYEHFHYIINFIITVHRRQQLSMCSGSVVVTAYDFESAFPGSNPEWGPIYYKASITTQGLPEPLSLRGSTLSTRATEHKGCNWGMQLS